MYSSGTDGSEPHNCVLCRRFTGVLRHDMVGCEKFTVSVQPLRCGCVFWERDPGADDEESVEFWRDVMERLRPPPPRPEMRPRTPEEARRIMGQGMP